MEILSKEFKLIALEYSQLGNRRTKNIIWTFLHDLLINVPTQGAQWENIPSKKHSKRCERQFRS